MALKANAKNEVLIGAAIVVREKGKKRQYLIVKNTKEDGWELPKTPVRRGESSVRAVIRFTGEQCGMTARILEEAGRYSSSLVLNGKAVTQKHYYYLLMLRNQGGEIMGFDEFSWVDLPIAAKRVVAKKEKDILKGCKEILKEWEKTKKYKMEEEEAAAALEASMLQAE